VSPFISAFGGYVETSQLVTFLVIAAAIVVVALVMRRGQTAAPRARDSEETARAKDKSASPRARE
jgi:hypothetical protein